MSLLRSTSLRKSGFQDSPVELDLDVVPDYEDPDNVRKTIDEAGAVGFLDLITHTATSPKGGNSPLHTRTTNNNNSSNQSNTRSDGQTSTKLDAYVADVALANGNMAVLRTLSYTKDALQAFFPNPRQAFVARDCDMLLMSIALCSTQFSTNKATSSSRRLQKSASSSSTSLKALQQAFSKAHETLEILGKWSTIFFSRTLVQEAPLEGAMLDKLRSAATIYTTTVDSSTSDAFVAAASLLHYLQYHEMDTAGILVGHTVNPALCSSLRFLSLESVCVPFKGALEWGANISSNSNSANPSDRTSSNERLPVWKRISALPKRENSTRSTPSTSIDVTPTGSPTTSSPYLNGSPGANTSSPNLLSFATTTTTTTTTTSTTSTTTSTMADPTSLPDVVSLIHEWAEMKDDAAVASAVRLFLQKFLCCCFLNCCYFSLFVCLFVCFCHFELLFFIVLPCFTIS
jgi:hypothetical protein